MHPILQCKKKVLLCECKRHTTHRIASTSCVALSRGGTWSQVWGVPHPDLVRGGGYSGFPSYLDLGRGTPTWTWDGVPPLHRPWMGYPPPGHGRGYHPLPGPGMWYPPTWTWNGVPPYLDLRWGTPLQV